MNIAFLMGGSNIQKNQEDYPLYLAEINEKLILELQIEYCMQMQVEQFIFFIQDHDIKQYRLDSIIKQITDKAKIIPILGKTQGAACTALLGIEYINNDQELILMAINDFIEDSGQDIIKYFRENNCDAGVVSFNSIHPRYSFAKINEHNTVLELAEKSPISKHALASFYYFKKGSDFVNCAINVIKKDNPINNAFYLSQTINEMILQLKNVLLYKISNDKFHSLKTEVQLTQYLSEQRESK